MKRRFHTTEMGPAGVTRWFADDEPLPPLDWTRVSAIETSQEMTVEQFKDRFPEIILPASMAVKSKQND